MGRCEEAMEELLVSWQLRPAVEALMGFKGFKIVAAMITVSELGNIHRFVHPRQLMAYLGLVPSESTSSDKRKQGGITKCGNAHARWLLVECSQHYGTPPKVSKELSMRQAKLDRRAKEVSWRAQNRLHSRFKKLLGRRLLRNKAITAVARELTEETGCTATKMEKLGAFFTGPGSTDENMHAYLATGLTRGEQNLETYERITVEVYPDSQVRQMVSDGTIHDGKTIATLGLYWLQKANT